MHTLRAALYVLVGTTLATMLIASGPTARGDDLVQKAELEERTAWLRENLLKREAKPPFSFIYGGQKSSEILGGWQHVVTPRPMDDKRTEHVLLWRDEKTFLEVRCVAREYADFPVVEWTVYLKNVGTVDTPVLESIQGLDVTFERGADGEFLLGHFNGDTSAPDLYEPKKLVLGPGVSQRFAPVGGRGSNGAFPYYNLVRPGGGVIMAVGWPGQWATQFERDGERALRVRAAQELTHLVLEPGEVIRSPLIAFLFWQGDDTVRAQNLWRRWMWAHNVPRTADGQPAKPILFGNTSGQFNEMCNADEVNQVAFIDRYRAERITIDFWWMDAGWYPCDGNWPKTGTWEPDSSRFPKGLRAISDHANSHGIQTLVWFEPERVAAGTWLSENHPLWLLGGTLLNLGNAEARQWLTDHVDRVLREQGIGLYRQDFNMDPLSFWRNNDAPDRQGMTENLHIQGYLAYWDELRARHPGMLIDSCASGGRRNDLETMRRAIALHPTDFNYADLTSKQAFHHSLFQWFPSYGSNTVPCDTVSAYAFRSGHAPNVVLGYDFRNSDLDYDLLRNLVAEWRAVSPCYEGDYYPLLPYNRDDSQWLAWQFHEPSTGEGVVEAFRRPNSDDAERVFRLRALDPSAEYEVSFFEDAQEQAVSGKVLMETGLRVPIPAKPGAIAIRYQRK